MQTLLSPACCCKMCSTQHCGFDLNVLKEILIFLIQLGKPDSLLYLKKNFQELVVYLFRICHGLVNQMVWVHVHEEALSLSSLIVLLCSLGQSGTHNSPTPTSVY